ncbi:MAG: LptF/LptG family permease [Phycisphaerae bacterium]|nr:LptF/LptG family permease [Phycisphaerae bacterium]
MRTLDRYIVRNFLTSAALWFVILMALRIVTDLFINMDEYVKGSPAVGRVMTHVAGYYAVHSLEYFAQLGGVIIVAAATFSLAMMGRTNELTAMLASGVSLHRIIWPIVLCAMLMGALIVVDQEMIIPTSSIAGRLARARDDPTGTQEFTMPFAVDGNRSVWRADAFYPARDEMVNPSVFLRDADLRQVAGILGDQAHPGELDGQKGWLIRGGVLLRSCQYDRVWPYVPDVHLIYTILGPRELAKTSQEDNPAQGGIRRTDRQYPMVLQAEAFIPASSGGEGGRLDRPRFSFLTSDGRVLATFVAASATWDAAEQAWRLQNAALFCPSDLTSDDLLLRRSSRWLEYMSSTQLAEVIRMRRVPDTDVALLVRHSRMTDPINNLIMLLLALPFILSRERRDVKASASLCLLMVGAFYAFVHLCRYVGLPPSLAAWLPTMLFGPVAVLMLDSVKT